MKKVLPSPENPPTLPSSPAKRSLKKKLFFTLGLIATAAGSGLLVYMVIFPALFAPYGKPLFKGAAEPAAGKKSASSPVHPLTGLPTTKEVLSLRPLSVMMENLAGPLGARPQSGLPKADVVYETLAEGGITRFLAVFHSQTDIPEIGPVRSARPYYVDWAAEHNAVYAHIGGSPEALNDRIPSLGVNSLNCCGGWYYRDQGWLNEGRAIEHTAFTTLNSLREKVKSLGWEKSVDLYSFLFKKDLEKEHRGSAQTVSITFSGLSGEFYAVRYGYDKDSNAYKRFMAGVPHTDRKSGEQIAPKNVLVMFWPNPGLYSSGHGRLDINNVGSGRAVLFQDGKATEGTWHKENHGARTRFVAADGQPFLLNPGQTWVEGVFGYSSVSY